MVSSFWDFKNHHMQFNLFTAYCLLLSNAFSTGGTACYGRPLTIFFIFCLVCMFQQVASKSARVCPKSTVFPRTLSHELQFPIFFGHCRHCFLHHPEDNLAHYSTGPSQKSLQGSTSILALNLTVWDPTVLPGSTE